MAIERVELPLFHVLDTVEGDHSESLALGQHRPQPFQGVHRDQINGGGIEERIHGLNERIGVTSLDDLPDLAPFLPEMADLDDMDQRAEVAEAEAVASS